MAVENLAASAPCCFCSAIALIAGLAALGEGSREYLLVRKIRNTPTSKVRSAAVGLVELAGKAVPTEEMKSPVTKNASAYWHVLAQYYHQSSHRGHDTSEWVTFYSKSSAARFYVEDDTGRMLIDPAGGEIRIKPDFSFEGHLSDKTFFGLIPQRQLDAQVLGYLKENPDAEQAFKAHGGQNIRLYEYFLAPKDDIYVLGSAKPLEGASSEVAHENLMVVRDKSEKILLVSDSSEKALTGSIGITSWVVLLFGLLLTAAAFIALLFGIVTSFALITG